MTLIPKICTHCKKNFEIQKRRDTARQGKFCSLKCSGAYRKANHTPIQNPPNCKCSTCSKDFYMRPSAFKNSKSGYRFCSRKCKDLAHSLRPEHSIPEMIPAHYGAGQSGYRVIAFYSKEKVCEDCGYDEIPEILEVHHKDRNRRNNKVENLKVLCPNCHEKEHFLSKDGRWK